MIHQSKCINVIQHLRKISRLISPAGFQFDKLLFIVYSEEQMAPFTFLFCNERQGSVLLITYSI